MRGGLFMPNEDESYLRLVENVEDVQYGSTREPKNVFDFFLHQ